MVPPGLCEKTRGSRAATAATVGNNYGCEPDSECLPSSGPVQVAIPHVTIVILDAASPNAANHKHQGAAECALMISPLRRARPWFTISGDRHSPLMLSSIWAVGRPRHVLCLAHSGRPYRGEREGVFQNRGAVGASRISVYVALVRNVLHPGNEARPPANPGGFFFLIDSYTDTALLRVHAGCSYEWLYDEKSRGRCPDGNFFFYVGGLRPLNAAKPLAVLMRALVRTGSRYLAGGTTSSLHEYLAESPAALHSRWFQHPGSSCRAILSEAGIMQDDMLRSLPWLAVVAQGTVVAGYFPAMQVVV